MTGGTGRVVGHFTDANKDPFTGTVSFIPSVTHLLVDGTTVLPVPVVCNLVNGYLTDDEGHQYVDLVATDAPMQNPLRFTYRVAPNLSLRGKKAHYAWFSIEVPGGLVTNLVDAARVPGTLSQGVSVGRQGPPGPPGDSGVVVLPAGSPVPAPIKSGVLYLRLIE